MKHIVNSAKETKELARQYSANLNGGDVIGLSGDLGAGKTTFVQGLAKSLGVTHNVTSPTFVIMKLYQAKHKTIKTICHVDAYRLKTALDLESIGIGEYLGAPDCLTIIEWSEKVRNILPKKTKYIKITHQEQSRIFEL